MSKLQVEAGNNKQTKLDELESLRGIAALIVVMSHVPAWSLFFHSFPIFRNAHLMVDLFFVLSGFVICKAYATKLNTYIDLFKFQFLRFGRLYPVHLTFLLVYLCIELIKYILLTKFNISSVNRQPFSDNDGFAFFKELLLIQAFWPNQQAIVFNGPAWSISAEFYTYFIFGLIAIFLKSFKFVAFASLFFICFVLQVLFDFTGYDFMIRCITGFFLGCLVSQYLVLIRTPKVNLNFYIYGLLMIIFLFVYYAKAMEKFNLAMFLLTALLIMLLVKNSESGKKTILSNALFIWLGKLSFSLYMSHSAVLWFYSQAVRLLFRNPEIKVNGLSTPQFSVLEAFGLITIFLILSIFVSYVIYTIIENPFRVRSRKLLGLKA